MIVKVDEKNENVVYDLELPDEEIIKKITTKTPVYFYALIDGKLFKSDQEKGLKSIYFSSKERLEQHLAGALYWRKGLIPKIGCGVGYDVNDFYKKLIETHNIEFKQVQF